MGSRQFRIPLGDGYATRIGAVNILPSSSGYVGAGVVGLMVVGLTSPSANRDAKLINCYSQRVGSRKVVIKRPGFETLNTPAINNIGTAIMVWTGQGTGQKVITAFGATTSTIYDGATSLGAITGRATTITETVVGANVPTIAVSSDNNTAWYYDTTVGVMTRIVDVDFPGNATKVLAGGFAHLDGFAFIMDTTGVLWASDLNSLTSWTATSFDSANAFPDKGVGCYRYKNYILAFGTESLQVFHNAGLTPFPLAKIPSMTVRIGAISADAITQFTDTVFWCGSTPQGGISIFKYDGGVAQISTPDIDALLILVGTANISLTTIRFYGRTFVLVRCGPSTLAYCIEENGWFEWRGNSTLWYKCAAITTGGNMVNYAISNSNTSGKVYLMNHASLKFTDDGMGYSAIIQQPLMDMGTSARKFFTDAELICDREIVSSPISLSYSDDDYNTFTTWGTLDLADERPRATRLGSARRRAWVLVHDAPTPMRIEALEGRYNMGIS